MIASILSFFIRDSYCYAQLIVNQVYVPISLLIYSHVPTAIVSLMAGFFLLSKDKKTLATKIFFALTLVFFLFTMGDLVEWFVFLGRDVVMFARSIIDLLDPLLFALAFWFLYAFIEKKDLPGIYKILLFLPLSPIVIRGLLHYNLIGYNWDICEVIESPFTTSYNYYIDLLYWLATIAFAIWSIIHNKANRPKIIIASVGVCLFMTLFFVMEFVLTGYIWGDALDYSYFVYAFFGMPLLIAFLGYVIVRYQEFNIKLVASETLVWALTALIGAQFFFVSGWASLSLTAVTFVTVLFFGRALVRSIKREIKQREEILSLAHDVERAYVIEKRAKDELARLDKFKDQFLMTTQHNLRTPLTSMMGYSDLLLKGVFGKQNKKTVEVIEKFQILTKGMIKMVNDFLNMAQFQLGRDVLSFKIGIDVLNILQEIITELEFKAKTKHLYLKLEAPEKLPVINADREKLKAAIFNVVDNAVKYTQKGGVNVMVETTSTAIKIIISDTGIGIPPEEVKGLFDSMFNRGEQAKKYDTVGSGVGLYLSAQIIKAHKGRIWVESGRSGSTFFVELPF